MQSRLFWTLVLATLSIGITPAVEVQASPTRQFDEQRFRELDTDNNKKLSEQEFIGEKAGRARNKAKKQFKTRDRDDNKSLSFNEYTQK